MQRATRRAVGSPMTSSPSSGRSTRVAPSSNTGASCADMYLSPIDLLSDTDELTEWFERSRSWIGTLEPKPTKK